MSGGRKTYRTEKLNDHTAKPSIHTIDYTLSKIRCRITEGKLRHQELADYLNSLNVNMYVALSEDATNIVGTCEYDSNPNQIVGLVPPLNEDTGMPIPSTFKATSAAAMESILVDPDIPIANTVNVVMAQPLAMNVPPFCLLVYGGNGKFTKAHVTKRWAFIVNELATVGIKGIVFASDSDPRYNGSMRDLILSHRTDELSIFPPWFAFDCSSSDYLPFQDHVHIGTKLKNRLLSDNSKLMFGEHRISKEHLSKLLDASTRDQHGLFRSDIENGDPMNFNAIQRMSDPKAVEMLKQHVEGSDGTRIFLKLTDKVLRSFLDFSLTPLERINNMWYAVFILRYWKEYIKRHPNQNSDNFITSYTYVCIEINAHSLVSLIMYLKKNKLNLFLPHLMSSQPCEFFFREFRSLSTIGSTFTTTSVLGMIRRCERIALMNEMSRTKCPNFTFVTESKRAREIYYNTNLSGYKTIELPTTVEIIEEIESAKEKAIQDAVELGVQIEQPFNFTCDIEPSKPARTKEVPKKSCPRVDGTRLNQFSGLRLRDYTSKLDLTTFDENSSYVAIDDINTNDTGERRIHVRKSSLCKLYMEYHTKLSSDRLKRVRQRAPPKININEDREALKKFVESNFDENTDDSSDGSWEASEANSDETGSSSDESIFLSDSCEL